MIKIIECFDVQSLECAVNNFLLTQSCFATQTHIVYEGEGKSNRYVAILFYNEVKK